MNFLIFVFLGLILVIIPFFIIFEGGRFNIVTIMLMIIPLGIMFIVFNIVVGEVGNSLCEYNSNSSEGEIYSFFFSGDCNDKDRDRIIKKKVDEDCIGRSGTVAYMVCDENGRICESKVKEC